MAPNNSKTVCDARNPGRRKPGPGKGDKKVPPLPVTIVQRTVALLRGLDLLLEHHDAPSHIRRNLDQQIHCYLDTTDSEAVWLKRCKHLLSYPLAKYLKNESPPKPDVSFKPSGKLKNWIKARLNAFNPRNTHLWYSWFQTKRCTLPLSKDIVKENYKKHFETLTQKDPADPAFLDEIFDDPTFQSILEKVRWAVLDYLSANPNFEDSMAKGSACFEEGRGFGGQREALRGLAGLPLNKESREKECGRRIRIKNQPLDIHPEDNRFDLIIFKPSNLTIPTIPSPDVLHNMKWYPWVHTKKGRLTNFHLPRTCAYGQDEWSSLKEIVAQDRYKDRKLDCTIQAVLEPNKIRIISKGEAAPYYSCKNLQVALWSAMKDISCFKLIGRPITSDDIIPLTRNAGLHDRWNSIDYSAATDGLSISFSERILKSLTSLLPLDLYERALQVLGPHNLYYPGQKGLNNSQFMGTMSNGQLMGSILSFPILCLANLGVYLFATKESQKYWTPNERINHVLINGDDMVYASEEEVWAKHVDVGKKVGLEMSVGKAYVHREYLNINSTSFHCPLHNYEQHLKGRVCREIGYLNTGLFYGQHKVQGKEGQKDEKLASSHHSDVEGIVPNINCLLRGSRPGKQIDLLKKLFEVQHKAITDECKTYTNQGKPFQRNLFIPESLGGMGVSAPEMFRFKISKEELYVAHGFINEFPDIPYTDQFPLPGYPLEKKLDPEFKQPWTYVCESEKAEKPIVPIKKISFPRLKQLCRRGFYRYVPNRDCATTTIPKVREKVDLYKLPVAPPPTSVQRNAKDRFPPSDIAGLGCFNGSLKPLDLHSLEGNEFSKLGKPMSSDPTDFRFYMDVPEELLVVPEDPWFEGTHSQNGYVTYEERLDLEYEAYLRETSGQPS